MQEASDRGVRRKLAVLLDRLWVCGEVYERWQQPPTPASSSRLREWLRVGFLNPSRDRDGAARTSFSAL